MHPPPLHRRLHECLVWMRPDGASHMVAFHQPPWSGAPGPTSYLKTNRFRAHSTICINVVGGQEIYVRDDGFTQVRLGGWLAYSENRCNVELDPLKLRNSINTSSYPERAVRPRAISLAYTCRPRPGRSRVGSKAIFLKLAICLPGFVRD